MARENWAGWVERLDRWGLRGMTAWLLDAAGPLLAIGAQALYFGQPFLNRDRIAVLAHLLEDEGEAHAFADFLREEKDT